MEADVIREEGDAVGNWLAGIGEDGNGVGVCETGDSEVGKYDEGDCEVGDCEGDWEEGE